MNLKELLEKFRSVDWLKVDFDISGPECIYCLRCDDISRFYDYQVLDWCVYLDPLNDLNIDVTLKSKCFLDVINNSIG